MPYSKTIVNLVGITLGSNHTMRTLGVVFDQDTYFSAHIKQICRTVFFDLHNISKIKHILSQSDAKKTSPCIYCF